MRTLYRCDVFWDDNKTGEPAMADENLQMRDGDKQRRLKFVLEVHILLSSSGHDFSLMHLQWKFQVN